MRDSREIYFRLEKLPSRAALEREWRALDAAGAHSFFLSWSWINAMLSSWPERFSLLRASRGDSTQALALVTWRHGWQAHLFPVRQAFLNTIGDPQADGVMIEHNGFALAGVEEGALWRGLLEFFAEGAFGARELVVPGMSQHKGALPREISSAENIRFAYRTDLRKVAETGVAQCVSRNTRQQLRRNLRDAGGNVAITAAKDKDEALAYFAELKALHIRSWEKRRKHHAFDNPIFEPFHHAVISTGIEDGSVELLRLEAGSRLLGYLYNFQRNGVVSSYQSGFAEEVARPGYLCHAAAMEHYAARGLLTYDFLAGTNQLKSSLGLERYELCWRRYRRPSLGVIAEQLAHWAVQRAKPAM